MKKSYWLGVLAVAGLSSLTGCSSDPEDNTPGGEKPPTGTQLQPPSSYTNLTAADAPAGAAPPAAWGAAATACSSCHGTNGEGLPSIAPEIRHITPAFAQHIVRAGRGAMPVFPATMPASPTELWVSDADLTAIITWLGSLPKPTTGAGLYKDFCGNCHGPQMGTGGSVPYTVTGLSAAEVTSKVRGGVGTDPSKRNQFMPKFDATVLTDAELMLIQQFLGSK
jgi:mono/diheme cytochrome c family protein